MSSSYGNHTSTVALGLAQSSTRQPPRERCGLSTVASGVCGPEFALASLSRLIQCVCDSSALPHKIKACPSSYLINIAIPSHTCIDFVVSEPPKDAFLDGARPRT